MGKLSELFTRKFLRVIIMTKIGVNGVLILDDDTKDIWIKCYANIYLKKLNPLFDINSIRFVSRHLSCTECKKTDYEKTDFVFLNIQRNIGYCKACFERHVINYTFI